MSYDLGLGNYIAEHSWILLFALAYSMIVFVFSPLEPLLYDNALYADIAKNVLQNHCFCSNFNPSPMPPVFPILTAVFMLLSGAYFIETMLAFLSFFTIMVSYHFVLKITENKRIAILSATFFFTTPLMIYNSMRLLTGVLFTNLLILSLWSYILLLEKGKKRMLLLCSVFTTLSIMTRLVGYLLIVIYIMYFILQRKKASIDIKQLMLLFFFIFLLLFPWNMWRLSIKSNEIEVAEYMFSESVYGHLVFRMESFFAGGEPMNANPVYIDIDVPVQVVSFVRVMISFFIYITPLMALSFLYFIYKRKPFVKNKFDYHMIIWVLTFLLFHIIFFYSSSRYLIPIILPIAFVFSRIVGSSLDKRKTLAVAMLLLHITSIAAITYFDFQFRWNRTNTTIFQDAGIWIRENTQPDTKILSLGSPPGALYYFSERRVVDMNETIPDIVVESDFWFSQLSLEEYERYSGTGFDILKEFSDDKYFVRIYERA
jgi:4-amino-4-deoxy-L-arabinose transferase-like glycosyltransferase